MPVDTAALPEPSRSSLTVTEVSLVVRVRSADRAIGGLLPFGNHGVEQFEDVRAHERCARAAKTFVRRYWRSRRPNPQRDHPAGDRGPQVVNGVADHPDRPFRGEVELPRIAKAAQRFQQRFRAGLGKFGVFHADDRPKAAAEFVAIQKRRGVLQGPASHDGGWDDTRHRTELVEREQHRLGLAESRMVRCAVVAALELIGHRVVFDLDAGTNQQAVRHHPVVVGVALQLDALDLLRGDADTKVCAGIRNRPAIRARDIGDNPIEIEQDRARGCPTEDRRAEPLKIGRVAGAGDADAIFKTGLLERADEDPIAAQCAGEIFGSLAPRKHEVGLRIRGLEAAASQKMSENPPLSDDTVGDLTNNRLALTEHHRCSPQRGTGGRVRPAGHTDPSGDGLWRDGEADPQTGKTPRLGQRPNHDDILDRLRGTPDTDVKITILRGGSISFDVTLTRAKIVIPTTRTAVIDESIGYLRIIQFTPHTAEKVEENLRDFVAQGVDSLIIDLRSNPGGLLDSVNKVADFFFEDGVIVSTQSRLQGESKVFEATKGAIVPQDWPIIALVDNGSASASEILAGALKDRQRGILIGETTYGKGSVQQIYPLGYFFGAPVQFGGSSNFTQKAYFKLTISRYFTPSGINIDSIGIEPNIQVAPPEYSEQELEVFKNLYDSRRIPQFASNNPDATDQTIKVFIQQLQKEGFSLTDRVLRHQINLELFRTNGISPPTVDLDWDIVLKAAVERLRTGEPLFP